MFTFHRTRILFAVQACVYLPYTLFLRWSSHIENTYAYRKFLFNIVSSVIFQAITTWRDIFLSPLLPWIVSPRSRSLQFCADKTRASVNSRKFHVIFAAYNDRCHHSNYSIPSMEWNYTEEQNRGRFRMYVCVCVCLQIMVLKLTPNLFDRFCRNFRWRFGQVCCRLIITQDVPRSGTSPRSGENVC